MNSNFQYNSSYSKTDEKSILTCHSETINVKPSTIEDSKLFEFKPAMNIILVETSKMISDLRN